MLTDPYSMLADPFATLGIPLTASPGEVLDRYDAVMQLLAPERYSSEKNRTYAAENRRFVEHAYLSISQVDQRSEVVKQLRQQAKSKPRPNSRLARALLKCPSSAVTPFYEGAIDDFQLLQYRSLNNIQTVVGLMGELNLVFLYVTRNNADEGGQEVKVPRSPRPSPPSFAAEAEPDVGIATVP
ncbi:molecular chaperone DnaJ [Leptolyngbya sp. NIES-3755]|nr:molecular chaperone DnaJ [Leptolyngbya sp. NIES-3755]